MTPAIVLSLLISMPAHGGAEGIDAAIDLYLHGRFADSAAILSNLIQKDPAEIKTRTWLGKTYLKLRRWDDAVRQFEKAVALAPKDGLGHLWLGRAYGNKAAHAFLPIGLANSTRKEFEKGVELCPDNVDIRFDLLEFYLEAPGIMGGGRDKAETQAGEIARLSPRHGYLARAEIYEDRKQWDRARGELTDATLKFPDDADCYADLARLLLERKDYAGAEANAQKAATLSATAPTARMLLAAAQIRLNRNVADALKALQELAAGPLADEDPPHEEIYYWLGQAYLAQGKNAEARLALLTSLNFNPEYSISKDALERLRQLP